MKTFSTETRIPNARRGASALGALLASCLFWACGETRVREYNAARWLVPETSFVYVQHDFVVTAEGGSIGRPESNGYPESSIKVFRRDIGPGGFTGKTHLLELDRVVPCGELVYRSADSLLLLSYLDLDGENGIQRHWCPDSLRRLVVGKLRGNLWTPLDAPGPDSLRALMAELRGSRLVAQGDGSLLIDSAYERLCAGGYCIRTGNEK